MSEDTLFRCPVTQQELKNASKQRVRALNKKVEAGSLLNHDGKRVMTPIEGGLERKDKSLLYVVQKGIPNFLISDAIPL